MLRCELHSCFLCRRARVCCFSSRFPLTSLHLCFPAILPGDARACIVITISLLLLYFKSLLVPCICFRHVSRGLGGIDSASTSSIAAAQPGLAGSSRKTTIIRRRRSPWSLLQTFNDPPFECRFSSARPLPKDGRTLLPNMRRP
jgi:hypothetical protein